MTFNFFNNRGPNAGVAGIMAAMVFEGFRYALNHFTGSNIKTIDVPPIPVTSVMEPTIIPFIPYNRPPSLVDSVFTNIPRVLLIGEGVRKIFGVFGFGKRKLAAPNPLPDAEPLSIERFNLTDMPDSNNDAKFNALSQNMNSMAQYINENLTHKNVLERNVDDLKLDLTSKIGQSIDTIKTYIDGEYKPGIIIGFVVTTVLALAISKSIFNRDVASTVNPISAHVQNIELDISSYKNKINNIDAALGAIATVDDIRNIAYITLGVIFICYILINWWNSNFSIVNKKSDNSEPKYKL